MAQISDETYKQLSNHHEKVIWTRFILIFLGLWLFFSPIAFGYCQSSRSMMISDMISGVLVCLFAMFAFSPTSKFWPYSLAIVGVWLNFAPLIFWAPEAVQYLNDTLVGSLIIAFSILIPSTPGESLYQGEETPAGWSYNPSSWPQRLPTMMLAVVSWFAARYMATYQLGYIDVMWDPLFGNEGTVKVITSKLSQSFPIPDAGMGAMAYCLEFLLGAKGGVRRWYTMPWLVIVFGILVVPLGIISILLVCSQPIIVHHWCAWCLLAGTCCMFMITFAINEVVAVLQYMHHQHSKGRSYWNILWVGGKPDDATHDTRTPGFIDSKGKIFSCMRWGVTLPWNLVVTALIGIWLMFSPWVQNVSGWQANSDYITGAITVVFSFICLSEVVRGARYVIGAFGIWLIVGMLILPIDPAETRQWTHIAAGILMILLCLPKGKIHEKYGTWDRFII